MDYKSEREKRSLTVGQVAKITKYGAGTISDLENHGLGGKHLKAALQKLYAISFGGAEQSSVPDYQMRDIPTTAEWERKLVADLRPLLLEDRERVLKTIQVMIEGLPQHPPPNYIKDTPKPPKPLTEMQAIAKQAGEKYDQEQKK